MQSGDERAPARAGAAKSASKKESTMEENVIGRLAQRTNPSFLSNKPMWAFWIFNIALFGGLFGLMYAAVALLSLQWWISVAIILLMGVIRGTYAYARNLRSHKAVKEAGGGRQVGPIDGPGTQYPSRS